MAYPGGPQEVVLAWAVANGQLIAGTNDGRVIVMSDETWETAGHVSPGIRSLCAIGQ